MRSYQKILAAVDFSKYSRAVLEHALTIATQFEAELYIINVINQRDIDMLKYTYQVMKTFSGKLTVDTLVKRMRDDRQHKANKLMKQLNSEHKEYQLDIKVGVPYQEIVNEAERVNAGLVILGDKGRGDLADTIVGSTTQKMLRKCPTALLITR